MKKLIFITIAIIVFAFGTSAQNITVKEGMYYQQGKLYTGIYTELNVSGGKKLTATIVDGKMNGAVTYYFDNEMIMETGEFAANEKSGQWLRYDETGRKTGEAHYLAGKKDGNWMIWDFKGNKRSEMHYAKGEKVGKWMQWDETGNVTSEKVYTTL